MSYAASQAQKPLPTIQQQAEVAQAAVHLRTLVSKKKQKVDYVMYFESYFGPFFTFVVACVLLAPIIALSKLDSNVNVRFWVGRQCLLAYVPIVIFVACLAIHLKKGSISKAATLATLFVPSILLYIVGDVVNNASSIISMELEITDCTTFEVKARMDKAYLLAKAMWADCYKEAKASNTTVPSFWHCDQVKAAPGRVIRDWAYLEAVEDQYKCGGWCGPDKMFWHEGVAIDSCSLAVGQDLAQVSSTSLQAQWLSFSIFLVFVWCYVTARSYIKEAGLVEW